MSDVVGSGISRVIVDIDGDASTVTNSRLDVNAIPLGGSSMNSFDEITVGTSAILLTDASDISPIGGIIEFIFQAQHENSGYIMVGDSGVTAASNGIRLYAGDTLILPAAATTMPSLRASGAGQKINVTAIFQ